MNMKRLLGVMGGLLLLVGTSAQSQTVFVGSESDFGAPAGYIFWGSLGPSFTQVAQPFTISSTIPGVSATVSQQNGANFERRDQGLGWNGNFAPGAELLWTQGANGPMSLVFNSPISAFGTQIQSDLFGFFTGVISAYDPSNNLLGSFNFSGTSTANADNSAPFIGVMSTFSIGSIVLSVSTGNPGVYDEDFAINQVRLNGTGTIGPVVPEPATLTLLGTGIIGLFGMGRRKLGNYRRNANA
jgi:hypothetical protein